MRSVLITAIFALGLPTLATAEQNPTDRNYPDYKAVSSLSGTLRSAGSGGALKTLLATWFTEFRAIYPGTNGAIEANGSASAASALASGSADLGHMSRRMLDSEIEGVERATGRRPLAIRIAVEALAIYVHKDNPARCLTLPQVDAMFSTSRRAGAKTDVTTWGQIGVDGEWAARPISLFGRNRRSGTAEFFREVVLFNGDYKPSIAERREAPAVAAGVASDPAAIGYSSVGKAPAGVKAIAIAAHAGESCFEPTSEHVASTNYPIARNLFLYLDKDAARPLDPLHAEFIRFVLSRQGQQAAANNGFIPVSALTIRDDLKAAGLEE